MNDPYFNPMPKKVPKVGKKSKGMKRTRINPISDKKRKQNDEDAKSEPEAKLQEYAEALCHEYGVKFMRAPDSLYKFIFANPSCPPEVREDAKGLLHGLPDMTLLDENGRYCFLELKRDSSTAKLRHAQKMYVKGTKYEVAKTKDEVKSVIEGFVNHEN